MTFQFSTTAFFVAFSPTFNIQTPTTMSSPFLPQLEQVAELLEDLQPRTSTMIAMELDFKNSSVSSYLTKLLYEYEFIRIEKIDFCPITGNKARFYVPIIWTKQESITPDLATTFTKYVERILKSKGIDLQK